MALHLQIEQYNPWKHKKRVEILQKKIIIIILHVHNDSKKKKKKKIKKEKLNKIWVRDWCVSTFLQNWYNF
jgi:3-keto-L-gulonate-6-phosphate decarboxylase